MAWSGAVEAALADAYRFSGGPLHSRGLVLGRLGSALMLLMPKMLLMFVCIVTLLLLPFLICGVGSKL